MIDLDNRRILTPDRVQVSEEILEKLRPYQREHFKKVYCAVVNYGSGLDSSSTGCGKSYVALSVAKALNMIPIILTAKTVIPGWERACKYLDIEEYYVSNYEAYKFGNTPYLENLIRKKQLGSMKRKPKPKWINLNPEKHLLIYDEVHRAKSRGTYNAKMLIEASVKRQGFKVLMLSATIAEDPTRLYATGFVLDLFRKLSDFNDFLAFYGCTNGMYGWGFDHSNKTAKEKLIELHHDIFPAKGSRIRKQDVPDWPVDEVIPEVVDFGSATKEINAVYKEMEDELEALKEKSKYDRFNILTVMLRARQRTELLKIPSITEMATDAIEEGNSIVIFCNFTATIHALSEKLKTTCIITGEVDIKQREINRAAFQADEQRVILCNSQTGGIGIDLHDIQGTFPRIALHCPTYSMTDMVQNLGRINRDGQKTPSLQKIIYAKDTIEESVCERVQAKLDNLSLLNDAELSEIQIIDMQPFRRKRTG